MKKLVKMLTENIAQTSVDHEDPNLVTQYIDLKSPVDAVSLAAKAFNLLPRAKVVDLDLDRGVIKAERKTFLRTFTDDMEVIVEKNETNKKFMVNVKSSSRVGKGDLGQNAKNIRGYYKALSELTKTWKDAEVIY